jgi:hypothetical protein
MERAVRGDEDVAAEMDGDCVGGFVFVFGVGRRRGRAGGGLLADEIAADDNVMLNDGLAGEDDVRRAVEEGAARDFITRVLWAGVVSVRAAERRGSGRDGGQRRALQSRCIRHERRSWAALLKGNEEYNRMAQLRANAAQSPVLERKVWRPL